MKLQTTAKLNRLRMSPRKVRLIADLVRGKDVRSALLQLKFSAKDAARPVAKLIESAVANAKHNHQMAEESLVIKTIMVDGGPTFHRWMPRAFGRATKLRKRTSHITVVLEGDAAAKKPAAKKTEKKEDVKEEKVVPKKKPAAKKTTKKPAAKKTTKKPEAKK